MDATESWRIPSQTVMGLLENNGERLHSKVAQVC